MIEQIFGIASELTVGAKGKAAAERLGRALVQRLRILLRHGRAAADLVRGELRAPAERIPDAGIATAKRYGALDQREAIDILRAARDEQRRQLFERFDVIGIERECAPRQLDGRDVVVGYLTFACLREEPACLNLSGRQRMPSTSASASASVKTRNEFVRTLPWLLTASDTRVIASSSGASAMTT